MQPEWHGIDPRDYGCLKSVGDPSRPRADQHERRVATAFAVGVKVPSKQQRSLRNKTHNIHGDIVTGCAWGAIQTVILFKEMRHSIKQNDYH